MVRSLQPIIQGLKEQGYDFVSITEMLVISGLSGRLNRYKEGFLKNPKPARILST